MINHIQDFAEQALNQLADIGPFEFFGLYVLFLLARFAGRIQGYKDTQHIADMARQLALIGAYTTFPQDNALNRLFLSKLVGQMHTANPFREPYQEDRL